MPDTVTAVAHDFLPLPSITPRQLNSEGTVCPKMFPFWCSTWDYDIIWWGNEAWTATILDFLIFPSCQKTSPTLHFLTRSRPFIQRLRTFVWQTKAKHMTILQSTNLEKWACHNMVDIEIQVLWTITCHTKLFPEKFQVKSESLAAFDNPHPSFARTCESCITSLLLVCLFLS